MPSANVRKPAPGDSMEAVPREPLNRPAAPRPRRWRRRLAIAVLVIVILLAGATALAPTLISTQAGTQAVAGVVNGMIRGRLAVDRLSLSWTGPLEVRGVRITDPAGKDVVRVSRITTARGVWRALTGWQAFEGLVIEKPDVLLQFTSDGRLTLADALSPRAPSPKKSESQPLPDLSGKVTVREGVVKVVREAADSYEFTDISGDIDLNTLNDLAGRVEMTIPQAAKITGNVKALHLFAADRRELSARLDVAGEVGSAQADVSFRQASGSAIPAADAILAAILVGESIDWPEFTADAKAAIDVGVLGRRFPRLLSIRADRQLTGGRLDIQRLNVSGGAAPSLSAAAALTDVTALEGTKTLRLNAIKLDGDAVLDAKKGLNLQQFTLQSGFAQVSASGTPSQFRSQLKANLADLQSELGQVFDFQGTTLAGNLNGTVQMSQSQADRMDVSLQADLSGLRYANKSRSLELAKASVAHGGSVAMVNGKPTRYLVQTLALNLEDEVQASGSGEYDWKANKLAGNLEVAKADLAFISNRAAGLGAAGLAGYSGGIRMQARMQYGGGTRLITSDGRLTGADLKRDGQPLCEGESRLEWSGLSIGSGDQGLQLDKAELHSVPAKLNVRDLRWRSGEQASLQGAASASADVAGCLAIAARLAKWQKTPAIAGRLEWNTTGALKDRTATVSGQGQIHDFCLGAGESAVRQGKVEFGYGVQIDARQNRLVVEKLNLAAQPLSLQAAGEIGRWDSERVLSLSGQYQASWPELTKLLHELAPATAQTIRLTGTTSSSFQITGAVHKPGAQPAFREVATGLKISWDAAELYGVKTGKAVLSPALKEGQLSLPPAAIPALEGKVNLAGMLDFQPADATVRLPGRLALLENVAVTREMGDLLLSRINPVFSHVTSLQGRVNLDLNDVVLPLGEAAKSSGTGRGRLDLRQMRMGPGAMLSELLALSGLGQAADYPVEIGAVDFTLKDGRIFYDNFSLTFPQQFDLLFRGSVGFDDTLDLIVSLPVRPELLTKLGVRGPVNDYAHLLAGSRIEVPLVGTREKPQLDFSRVDTDKLLKGVVEKAAGQQAQDLLKLVPGLGKPK